MDLIGWHGSFKCVTFYWPRDCGGLWMVQKYWPSAQIHAEFEQKSQRAFWTMALAVCSSQLYLITSVEKPMDACLGSSVQSFWKGGISQQTLPEKQYFCTEMKEGIPIEEHFKHMKEITDKLASIRAPISEEDQLVMLLGSLPSIGYCGGSSWTWIKASWSPAGSYTWRIEDVWENWIRSGHIYSLVFVGSQGGRP